MPKPQKKEKFSESAPIAVQVARYSALAAIITVAGSFLNTMWVERPWWKQKAPEAIVSPINVSSAPITTNTDEFVHHITGAPNASLAASAAPQELAETASAMDSEPQASVTMSFEPTWYDGILDKMEDEPIKFWGTIAAGIVGAVSMLVEYLFRKKKKLLKMNNELESLKENFTD